MQCSCTEITTITLNGWRALAFAGEYRQEYLSKLTNLGVRDICFLGGKFQVAQLKDDRFLHDLSTKPHPLGLYPRFQSFHIGFVKISHVMMVMAGNFSPQNPSPMACYDLGLSNSGQCLTRIGHKVHTQRGRWLPYLPFPAW